jgi:hypothetical protein
MDIEPYKQLAETLTKAEEQCRAIVEGTGRCLPLLNRIRSCTRESQERVRAYQHNTRPAPKPPRTPAPKEPAKPDSNKVNGAKRPGIQEQIKPEEGAQE